MHTDVICPILHLNGDRKDTLMTNLKTTYRAVKAAITALQASAPNARNYYPEPGLWDKAHAQHKERVQHLQAVLQSLVAEANGIDANG